MSAQAQPVSAPAYPAMLEGRLDPAVGRWLVKWLLAIPQYLIVGIFASGAAWGGHTWGYGLIGVLCLIAAVTLAFTGRYPEQMFDLVMGLNRWCYRVLTYAALMRDEYPPFRLDLGGADPGRQPPEVQAT